MRDILRLHQHAHREGYPDGTAAAYPATHPTHPSARSACDPHGRTTDETVQPSLTQREIDVLRLVVAGLLNKQIAQRLDVALTTVISHRRNLVRKLGIRSVAGLTIYAVTKGTSTPSNWENSKKAPSDHRYRRHPNGSASCASRSLLRRRPTTAPLRRLCGTPPPPPPFSSPYK